MTQSGRPAVVLPRAPVLRAQEVLGCRLVVMPGTGFRLDGRPCDLRAVVAAANLAGARIVYPGVLPPVSQRIFGEVR